jgi:hypothetical protein
LELIQEAIRVLRYQHEELEALMDQIKWRRPKSFLTGQKKLPRS